MTDFKKNLCWIFYMGGLSFYTYMISVCVGGIYDWQQTSEKNTFTSISNCKVAAGISIYFK